LKLEKWHVSITVVCLLFGALFTSNLRAHLHENPMAARNKTLVNVIKTQDQKIAELEAEIKSIREKIQLYQTAKTAQTELEPLQKELDRMKFLAGLTAVEGPGVQITLKDQEKAKTAKESEVDFYIIHYTDILYIVNDLRAGGAEAISVNGERVVSTSDIRCAGVFITVNLNRLAPPYKISAVGNPDNLEAAVRAGEYTMLEQAHFPVTLEKSQSVLIPEYKGSYTFNYASPPKEGV